MVDSFLYLHGFASGPGSQKAAFFRRKFLARGVELRIPDLSDGDFDGLTLTRQLAVIDREAASRSVSLIGSSLGGYLAALYAARNAEVHKVVLMAPAFGFARRWTEALGPEKVDRWRRTGALELYHYGDRCHRRLGYQFLEDATLYEDYPQVSQPVLLFHGEQDVVVPFQYSREFAAQRPNVQLEALTSDHELLNVLETMWDHVSRFLLV